MIAQLRRWLRSGSAPRQRPDLIPDPVTKTVMVWGDLKDAYYTIIEQERTGWQYVSFSRVQANSSAGFQIVFRRYDGWMGDTNVKRGL